jgi:ubiquitin C-terminal hydrolase
MPEKGLVGLPNLGNTCYLNSITQCLMHTIPLVKYLALDTYKDDLLETHKYSNLVKVLSVLAYNMWVDNPNQENVNKITMSYKRVLSDISDIFKGFNQEDSSEAMSYILDALHESLKYPVKIEISGTPRTRHQKIQYNSIKSWEEYVQKNYSIIMDIFAGQFHITTIKNPKLEVSHSFQPFHNLMLHIPNNATTLYDCLDAFTEQENIEDKMLKKTMLYRLPKILVIQLSRFTNNLRKINKFIDYPKTLNMSKYTSSSNVEKRYSLYAVCNHYGSMGGGHYTASASVNGKWYNFNDSMVSPISEVVSAAGYILFYRRLDLR